MGPELTPCGEHWEAKLKWKKWKHGPGGGLGRGQRQLGIPTPAQEKHLWGHPRPPLKSSPCPIPGCFPNPTNWHWGKGGERCQMLKNETPGCDPCSSPSPRHSVGGEVTVNFSLAVSLRAPGDQI